MRGRFRGTPYFPLIPFKVNLLNLNTIFSVLHDTVTKHDLGVLRIKTDDPDNLLCQRQKMTLAAGTLVQEAIIVSTNSSMLILVIVLFSILKESI